LPVWGKCARYKEYPTSEVVKLLLGKDVPANRVCSPVPTCVQLSVSFIVSIKAVKDPKGLRAEENWDWEHKGLRSGQNIKILSRKHCPKFRPGGSAKMFCLKKAYHSLQSSNDFHRMIVTMEGMSQVVAVCIKFNQKVAYEHV